MKRFYTHLRESKDFVTALMFPLGRGERGRVLFERRKMSIPFEDLAKGKSNVSLEVLFQLKDNKAVH